MFHVDAIEPSELLMITLSNFDRRLERFPDIARGYQLGLERGAAARERRIALSLNSTAEERYDDFIDRHPSIASRLRIMSTVICGMNAAYSGCQPLRS
jgi:CRP-like cAMP-binding protein